MAFICINSKLIILIIQKISCPIIEEFKLVSMESLVRSTEELKLIFKVCLPFVWITLNVAEYQTVGSGLFYIQI